MYSIDTGHFYSNREMYLHNQNRKYRMERNYVKNKLDEIIRKLNELGLEKEHLNRYKKDHTLPDGFDSSEHQDILNEFLLCNKLITHKRKKAYESKDKLLKLLSNKISQNEKTDGHDHIRVLREDKLNDNNVISVFESFLTRTIGIEQDEFTDDLMVMQVYYFDVFKDTCFYGFMYKGEKYRYYTSSAGQIRKKKAVFIKESTWERIQKTIMCGLTVDAINAKGGNNVNKHLAYLALSNSATDEWERFNIDKTIVIEDFETMVEGTYDLIDDIDYSITRKKGYVPIPHTDGSGMVLPRVSKKNFMFRAPWMKGLLGSFAFDRFIEENGYSPVIKDIYGVEHNVIEEGIEIILTKSMFKLWKYYDSFEQYREYFKMYNCSAGICNVEEDRVSNAKINYQMLQTLTDISSAEADRLIKNSSDKLRNMIRSKEDMMGALGINPYNTSLSPLQKAIKIYPPLLCDRYVRAQINEFRNSLLKKYRSGKLEIYSKYAFILPDFYAACEFWFGGIENPKGLLDDGEVYCRLFKHVEKLDCLRSPHLYKEHAVRKNVAYRFGEQERLYELNRWFDTDGLYTSTHDLISKILQFDVDGDKSLIVADKEFVRIAERNMEGIVPLYYNMRKAGSTEINNKTIYAGLNAAFVGGNIGIYSNDISKIWNNDVFLYGTEEEKQEAVDAVKLLCMENNFVIDYAKTLYKPVRPKEKNELITKYTHGKLPAFFMFAKDKTAKQTIERNESFVNTIYDKVKKNNVTLKHMELDEFDWHNLMMNKNIVSSREVEKIYDELNRRYRFMINVKEEYTANMNYVASELRSIFSETGYSNEMITDMLVYYLYSNDRIYKQVLWFCYGDIIVRNLLRNVQVERSKLIKCIDCGEWFEAGMYGRPPIRCEKCQRKYNKKMAKINNGKYYERRKQKLKEIQ